MLVWEMDPCPEALRRWLQDVVDQGWATGVRMPELERLQQCLEALHWTESVRRFPALIRPQPAVKAQPLQSPAEPCRPDAEEAAQLAECNAKMPAVQATSPPQAANTGAIEGRPEDMEIDVASAWLTDPGVDDGAGEAIAAQAALAPAAPDVLASLEATETLPTDDEGPSPLRGEAADDADPGPSQPMVPVMQRMGEGRPSVAVVQDLVEQGEALPVEAELLAALRHNLDLALAWEDRLQALLPARKVGSWRS